MKNKLIYILLIAVVIVAGALVLSVKTASAVDNVDPTDLMSQGKIRTCLKADFVGDRPNGYPPIQTATFHLTGFCGSKTGCTCVWNQGTNGATARMEGECNDFRDENDCKVSKDELKARRGSKDKSVAKKANKCTSCGHTAADARQPVLVNLQPKSESCNIVQNKIAQANISANNRVLGASTVLPYGPVDVVVKEDTARHTDSDFYAVGDLEGTSTDLGTGGGASGEAKTEQLGILEFRQEDFTAPDVQSSCTTISWDPYGRVFDAQTLEPISDSEVTLMDAQTNKPVEQQFEDNFDITGNDGVFNILVEKEGSYKLDAIDNVSDHLFVSNPTVNPLWSKIYSDLYVKDKIFFEKPRVPTHHDIALTSTTGPYHGAVSVLIDGTLQETNIGDNMVYRGRVSFPFAKVCLKEEGTGRTVGKCVNANNIGKFTIAVPKSQVPDKRLLVTTSKVNLTDPNLYKSNSAVETLNAGSSVSVDSPVKYYFDPVLSHVEGYAYGEDGKVIPGATVKIIIKNNNKVYYQTKADASGFFTVYAKNLPYLEYYLQVIDPVKGTTYTKTTTQFVSENRPYLESKKINLVTAQKNSQPLINPKTGQLNEISDAPQGGNEGESAQINKNNPIKFEVVAVVFVLIALVVGALGIAIYIKRQNSNVA